MLILVNLELTEEFKEIFVDENTDIESLKYIIEAEFNIPFVDQEIKFEGSILTNSTLIKNTKIKENDIIIVSKKIHKPIITNNNNNRTQNTSNIGSIFDQAMNALKSNQNNLMTNRVKNECQRLKEFYLNNPDDLSMLLNTDVKLAEAILSNNDPLLETIIGERINKYETERSKEQMELNQLMNSDPNDAESQKRIEELIKMKNIDENFKMAQEYLPESFGHIHMLYIPLQINRNKVIALVDTGAQSTIMSVACAKRCGVFNLVDTRFHGIAKGVGTSKIIGVVHAAQIQIGGK